jgi:3-hydroxyacyl-CoA dehydrogenase
VQQVIKNLEAEGRTLPPLLQKMKESGADKFYNGNETVTPSGEKTDFKAPYFIVADLKKDAT